jgi:tetratricopeptide (TPR) repeat protein
MNDERNYLLGLREQARRRLAPLEERAARYGIDVPPHVPNEIDDMRGVIAGLDARLGAIAALRLPVPVADFVGRVSEIDQLVAALRAGNGRAVAISSVRGLGGLGKTQLSLAVAQQLVSDFPDGHVWLSLQGASSSPMTQTLALQTVIRSCDRTTQTLPDDLAQLEAIYASTLDGRRVLVLADDARDAAHVRPLLPPAGCALLITSRKRFTLPGLTALDLDALPEREAVALVVAICGRLSTDEATRLVQLCGRLPLALRVSASILANDITLAPARFLERLERERLTVLRDPDDKDADVESSLRLSYDALDFTAQSVLCQLSVFRAPFDLLAAEAVLQPDMPADPDQCKMPAETLSLLYRHSLLSWDTRLERYRLHDLVRAFAADRLVDRDRIWERYAHHYAEVATRARDLYRLGGDHIVPALGLFDAERAHIDAGWAWARAHAGQVLADGLLLQYAKAVIYIGSLRYDSRREQVPQFEAALAAARRLGWRKDEGIALGNLGKVYTDFSEYKLAIDAYEQYLAMGRKQGDRLGEAYALCGLGSIYGELGDMNRAIELLDASLLIFRELGDRHGEGNVLCGLGITFANLGRAQASIKYLEQALVILREVGDRRAEGDTLGSLGNVYTDIGDVDRAIELHGQQLMIARELGDRRGESNVLGNLGIAYAVLDEPMLALDFHRQELELKRRLGDRFGEANALFNMSLVEYVLDNWSQAIAQASAALDIFEQIGVAYLAGMHQLIDQWRQAHE